MFNLSEITLITSTTIGSSNISVSSYEKHKELFWVFATIYLFIGLLAVVGNVLVLYASISTRNIGRLRYFDGLIKSLAVADMLFGLIGIPGKIITSYYIGM